MERDEARMYYQGLRRRLHILNEGRVQMLDARTQREIGEIGKQGAHGIRCIVWHY